MWIPPVMRRRIFFGDKTGRRRVFWFLLCSVICKHQNTTCTTYAHLFSIWYFIYYTLLVFGYYIRYVCHLQTNHMALSANVRIVVFRIPCKIISILHCTNTHIFPYICLHISPYGIYLRVSRQFSYFNRKICDFFPP